LGIVWAYFSSLSFPGEKLKHAAGRIASKVQRYHHPPRAVNAAAETPSAFKNCYSIEGIQTGRRRFFAPNVPRRGRARCHVDRIGSVTSILHGAIRGQIAADVKHLGRD
jgi:hypothetical protein